MASAAQISHFAAASVGIGMSWRGMREQTTTEKLFFRNHGEAARRSNPEGFGAVSDMESAEKTHRRGGAKIATYSRGDVAHTDTHTHTRTHQEPRGQESMTVRTSWRH